MIRFLSILTLLCIAALPGCGKSDPNASQPPDLSVNPTASDSASDSSSASDNFDPQKQLTLEPEQTFAQSCARCHGPEGRFYALPFKFQGDALREKIRMMMTGNAQLSPTQADIDAMLHYHLQIRDKLQTKTP